MSRNTEEMIEISISTISDSVRERLECFAYELEKVESSFKKLAQKIAAGENINVCDFCMYHRFAHCGDIEREANCVTSGCASEFVRGCFE